MTVQMTHNAETTATITVVSPVVGISLALFSSGKNRFIHKTPIQNYFETNYFDKNSMTTKIYQEIQTNCTN